MSMLFGNKSYPLGNGFTGGSYGMPKSSDGTLMSRFTPSTANGYRDLPILDPYSGMQRTRYEVTDTSKTVDLGTILIFSTIYNRMNFLTDEIMPIISWGASPKTFVYSVENFKSFPVPQVPETAPPRFVSSATLKESASFERYAIGFTGSSEYYKTEPGKENQKKTLKQIAMSVSDTHKNLVIAALHRAPIQQRGRLESLGQYQMYDLIKAQEREVLNFARPLKEKHGLIKLLEYYLELMQKLGGEASSIICTKEMNTLVLNLEERTDYYIAGPDGPATVRDQNRKLLPNGMEVFYLSANTEKFGMKQSAGPWQNILQIGDYSLSHEHPALRSPSKTYLQNYHTGMRENTIYDQETDGFAIITPQKMLDNCHLFITSTGKLSSKPDEVFDDFLSVQMVGFGKHVKIQEWLTMPKRPSEKIVLKETTDAGPTAPPNLRPLEVFGHLKDVDFTVLDKIETGKMIAYKLPAIGIIGFDTIMEKISIGMSAFKSMCDTPINFENLGNSVAAIMRKMYIKQYGAAGIPGANGATLTENMVKMVKIDAKSRSKALMYVDNMDFFWPLPSKSDLVPTPGVAQKTTDFSGYASYMGFVAMARAKSDSANSPFPYDLLQIAYNFVEAMESLGKHLKTVLPNCTVFDHAGDKTLGQIIAERVFNMVGLNIWVNVNSVSAYLRYDLDGENVNAGGMRDLTNRAAANELLFEKLQTAAAARFLASNEFTDYNLWDALQLKIAEAIKAKSISTVDAGTIAAAQKTFMQKIPLGLKYKGAKFIVLALSFVLLILDNYAKVDATKLLTLLRGTADYSFYSTGLITAADWIRAIDQMKNAVTAMKEIVGAEEYGFFKKAFDDYPTPDDSQDGVKDYLSIIAVTRDMSGGNPTGVVTLIAEGRQSGPLYLFEKYAPSVDFNIPDDNSDFFTALTDTKILEVFGIAIVEDLQFEPLVGAKAFKELGPGGTTNFVKIPLVVHESQLKSFLTDTKKIHVRTVRLNDANFGKLDFRVSDHRHPGTFVSLKEQNDYLTHVADVNAAYKKIGIKESDNFSGVKWHEINILPTALKLENSLPGLVGAFGDRSSSTNSADDLDGVSHYSIGGIPQFFNRSKDFWQTMRKLDRLYTDPVVRACVVAYICTQFSKGSLESLLSNNVRIPMNFLVVRPHMNYVMSKIILCSKGVEKLGFLGVASESYSTVQNLVREMTGHVSFMAAPVVLHPENISVIEGVVPVAYGPGGGSEWWDRTVYDPKRSGSSTTGKIGTPSLMCFAVPFTETKFGEKFDIGGKFLNQQANSKSRALITAPDEPRNHYSTSERYNKIWKFNQTQNSTFMAHMAPHGNYPVYNRIAYQGTVLLKNLPNSENPNGSYSHAILNKGHWGPNVGPGCKTIFQGNLKPFEDPGFRSKYTIIS